MIQYLSDHPEVWTAIAALSVALIDLGWALNPNLKSNGILHAVYDFLTRKKPQP